MSVDQNKEREGEIWMRIGEVFRRNFFFQAEDGIRDPLWSRELGDVYQGQVHDHLDILQKLRPRSVEQLAAVLAIIRPAKRHLSNHNWNKILEVVWVKPTDGTYYFKKSHAISYAILIVMQLNSL